MSWLLRAVIHVGRVLVQKNVKKGNTKLGEESKYIIIEVVHNVHTKDNHVQ